MIRWREAGEVEAWDDERLEWRRDVVSTSALGGSYYVVRLADGTVLTAALVRPIVQKGGAS